MARSRRSTFGENRSTEGAFDDEEMAAFLLGTWVDCRSTVVATARYIAEARYQYYEASGRLEVVFKTTDGASYYYEPFSFASAVAFGKAPSKRGFFWDNPWTKAIAHRDLRPEDLEEVP